MAMTSTTYLTSAWRNLVRNRMYTILNVLGLSLSIGIAIVIFMIIRFEHSFDTWHTNSARLSNT